MAISKFRNSLKTKVMKELKRQYDAIKSLAVEMLKIGNVPEHIRLLQQANELKLELVRIK